LQDLDEGRLAGAVPARECVDFTRTHVEVDVLEHGDAVEGLADAVHSDRERSLGGHARVLLWV
jgi:hypothetical protein